MLVLLANKIKRKLLTAIQINKAKIGYFKMILSISMA